MSSCFYCNLTLLHRKPTLKTYQKRVRRPPIYLRSPLKSQHLREPSRHLSNPIHQRPSRFKLPQTGPRSIDIKSTPQTNGSYHHPSYECRRSIMSWTFSNTLSFPFRSAAPTPAFLGLRAMMLNSSASKTLWNIFSSSSESLKIWAK